MSISKKVETKIIKKIIKYRKDGFNDYQIKLSLIRNNYPPHTIDNLLEESLNYREKEHHIQLIISIIALIVILPLLFLSLKMTASPEYETCTNEYCFIAQSKLCRPALFETTIGDFSVLFTSESCTVTKKVTGYHGEDSELNNLIGKSLTCSYEKYLFDKEHLKSLSYSIENCHGDLRNHVV